MSVFTNPAGASKAQAAEYIAAVLGLLGDRDPLEVLHATPAALAAVTDALPAAALARPEAEGQWSIRHLAQHLADSELVWGWRVRLVLAQDRPPLTGYDQDRWADRLHYERADAVRAARDFAMLRAANLRLIEAASPADLARVGVHAERGEESLTHMIRLYAGHDLLHLNQLERIRQAVTGRR
ncbi:MAG: DinB family protein [Vicinamibacterales bacterium]